MNALTPIEPVAADGALVTKLQRAEIDQQIATARSYPRSIERAVSNIAQLATLDEETAQECTYALPRGDKTIEGPSARLAEIIVSQWGNCRAAARVVHVDKIEKYIEAEGIFHDLETNALTTKRVRRRISDKYGKCFNDDMIIVTGNAACSIAQRNAVLGGVPKGVWRAAYARALAVVTGTAATLAASREKTLKAFNDLGIDDELVFKAIDVAGFRDISLNHIGTLRGMYAALKNGEATREEMFGEGKVAQVARKPAPEIPDDEPDKPEQEAKQEPAKAEAPAQQSQPAAETAAQQKQAPAEQKQTAVADTGDMFPGDRPSKGSFDADAWLAELGSNLRNCDSISELEKIKRDAQPTIKRLSNNYAQRAHKLIDDAFYDAA